MSVVSCTWIVEEPPAERMAFGVEASANMSVMCAVMVVRKPLTLLSYWRGTVLPLSTVCVVKYCFDCYLLACHLYCVNFELSYHYGLSMRLRFVLYVDDS